MSGVFFGSLGKQVPMVAVIMAGGSGTRFWPLSRTRRPKQFLPLAGSGRSLIQATADRLADLVGSEGVMVVTAGEQRELVQEQLPGVSVLVEPMAKNTAACIGFAAIKILSSVGDVPMICLPADHLIHGVPEILEVYRRALTCARASDSLVTIGIKPTHPETGYGYIQRGTVAKGQDDAFLVERFVEKPNLRTAEEYMVDGGYFWNSGMFIWRPSIILAAMKEFVPELHAALMEIEGCFGAADEADAVKRIYSQIKPVSIDVGVMEKAENVLMLAGDSFRWSDVGSWAAWVESLEAGVHRIDRDRDAANVVEADALMIDSERCAVVGCEQLEMRRFIAGVGLKDIVIVETEDAVLVCHRDRAQEVKRVVDAIRESNRLNLL